MRIFLFMALFCVACKSTQRRITPPVVAGSNIDTPEPKEEPTVIKPSDPVINEMPEPLKPQNSGKGSSKNSIFLLPKAQCESDFRLKWSDAKGCFYKDFLTICQGLNLATVDTRHTLAAIGRKYASLGGTPSCGAMHSWLLSIPSLDLSGEKLIDLAPLAYLPLSELRLDDNSISDLSAISTLKYLKVLSLKKNSIDDLDLLKGLTTLTSLDVSANAVATLYPLSSLVNLEELYASYTTSVDADALKALSKLQVLALNGVGVYNIDFIRNLPKLKRLYLADNKIRSFADSRSSDVNILGLSLNLKVLDLAGNYITSIQRLENLIGLTSLNLKGNNITSADVIGNFEKIEFVDLSQNPIKGINSWDNLNALRELHLDDMPLTSIFFVVRLPMLRVLTIKNCQITDYSSLSSTQLTSLDVTGCKTHLDSSKAFPNGEPSVLIK